MSIYASKHLWRCSFHRCLYIFKHLYIDAYLLEHTPLTRIYEHLCAGKIAAWPYLSIDVHGCSMAPVPARVLWHMATGRPFGPVFGATARALASGREGAVAA